MKILVYKKKKDHCAQNKMVIFDMYIYTAGFMIMADIYSQVNWPNEIWPDKVYIHYVSM